MITMRIIQFVILLPMHLAMCALCWVLSPLLPLFALGRETLPRWLLWFQTPDAPLDGDSGFNDPAQHPFIARLPRYIRRTLWLIRNPAYGFAWSVLAYQPRSGTFDWRGSYPVGKVSGYGWYMMSQSDGHFQFYTRVKSLFGKQLMFRFGWKIIGLATHGGDNWLERKKFVFTFNPFDGG